MSPDDMKYTAEALRRVEVAAFNRGLLKAAQMAEASVDEGGAIMDPYELIRRLRAEAEE